MPAITVKDIPEPLYNELKFVAQQHHRSVNSQVILCLRRILFPKRISKEQRLSNIQQLRSQITPNIITVEDIDKSINEGRA